MLHSHNPSSSSELGCLCQDGDTKTNACRRSRPYCLSWPSGSADVDDTGSLFLHLDKETFHSSTSLLPFFEYHHGRARSRRLCGCDSLNRGSPRARPTEAHTPHQLPIGCAACSVRMPHRDLLDDVTTYNDKYVVLYDFGEIGERPKSKAMAS